MDTNYAQALEDVLDIISETASCGCQDASLIEQKILPADWRCADAESEENDAQPDGNPA